MFHALPLVYEQGCAGFGGVCNTVVDSWQVYDATKTLPVLIDEGGQA